MWQNLHIQLTLCLENRILGKEVLIVKKITPFEKGEAKGQNGVVWTAKCIDDSEIEENTICIVEKIEGNTLLLRKK